MVTEVGAAPVALRRLAEALDNAGSEIVSRARALAAVGADLAVVAPDLAPQLTRHPLALVSEAALATDLASEVRALARALELADDLGVASLRGGIEGLPPVFFVEEASLGQLLAADPRRVFDAEISRLEARLAELESDPPPDTRPGRARRRRWSAEMAAIRNELGQYRALVDPSRTGWGGAGTETWLDHESFVDDVAIATAAARALVPRSDTGARYRSAAARQRAVRAQTRLEHPFLSAALGSGVIVTPGRLRVLVELDSLMTVDEAEFSRARARATESHPHFDWTSNGCSGPIPEEASRACLRHDFAYRNARMLRDQWGLSQGFAEKVKSSADDIFASELWGSYEWYRRGPLISGWIWSAEAAVGAWGSVEARWEPPPKGRFWGDVPP